MEFSRPEYWNWYPFPSPGDLPNPGIEPRSPALQVDSLPGDPRGKPLKVGRTQQFLLIPTMGCDIAEKSEITRKDLQL